jgi:membrane protease YdiL (CAAX protease family)
MMNTPVNEVAFPLKGQSPPPPVFKEEERFNLFVGRLGLRAGWGIAIYFVFIILLSTVFNVATLAATGRLSEAIAKHKAHAVAHKRLGLADQATTIITLDDTAIGAVLGLAGLALASWLLSLIERRRIAVYGIGRLRLNDFLSGALSGLISLSLLIGLLSASHYLVFDSRALSGPTVTVYGISWLITYLLVGLLEEYLSRGYLQYTLTRGLVGLGERVSSTHARGGGLWDCSGRCIYAVRGSASF